MSDRISAADLYRTFSVREASVITGVESNRIDRMIEMGLLPKRAVFRRQTTCWLAFAALLMIRVEVDCSADLSRAVKKTMFDALSDRGVLGPDPGREGQIKISRDRAVDMREPIAAVRDGLMRLKAAELAVTFDPEIRGGMLVLKGTRIGVYELAGQASLGSLEETLQAFPQLSETAIAQAVLYAKAHPLKGWTEMPGK